MEIPHLGYRLIYLEVIKSDDLIRGKDEAYSRDIPDIPNSDDRLNNLEVLNSGDLILCIRGKMTYIPLTYLTNVLMRC